MCPISCTSHMCIVKRGSQYDLGERDLMGERMGMELGGWGNGMGLEGVVGRSQGVHI